MNSDSDIMVKEVKYRTHSIETEPYQERKATRKKVPVEVLLLIRRSKRRPPRVMLRVEERLRFRVVMGPRTRLTGLDIGHLSGLIIRSSILE